MISRKKLIILASFAFIMWMIMLFTLSSIIENQSIALPDPAELEQIKPSLITKVYDVNGEVAGEMFSERRTLVPLGKIPVDMQNAIIATEDTRFFRHWGMSLRDIIRASVTNILHGRVVQGASSITQQLSRVLFLSREKTFDRKIKEALLALQIENKYSKEEILEMYLNQVYFGHGAYGISSASQTYFSKRAEELTLAECALLAGIIRSPANYSPFNHPESAQSRFKWVLSRMRKNKYISRTEEQSAIELSYKPQRFKFTSSRQAPYFMESIRQYLEDTYGINTTYKSGLKVYTTLDMSMQRKAEEVLEEHLARFDEVKGSTVPVQGALVSLDVKTGKIKALIGGRDFSTSQFNRATQAKRQPGSAFKPFVYTAALDKGYTAATLLNDSFLVYYYTGRDWELLEPATDVFTLDLSTAPEHSDKIWMPQNYDEEFLGNITLRKALEQSRNVCAVRLISQIGPYTAVDYAHKMGIDSYLGPNLSLALGSSEVTLLELTRAFSTLANKGIRATPYSIIKIEDSAGNILEVQRPKEEEVLSPQTAYLITDLLNGVIENGTGYSARFLGRPAAGKTGTTNEFNDAWFIGYTPELVTGVWVGYDDRSTLGKKQSGGAVAAPIWTDYMRGALKGKPVLDFPVPDNIVFIKIDPLTGLLAREDSPEAIVEAFAEGNEPMEYAP
ncbi:MAG: PBP1A family penicillin-binding protein [bacterium]